MMLNVSQRKGFDYIGNSINAMKKHIMEKGGTYETTYIRHAIVGKAVRSKKIDIRARGKGVV